MKKINLLLTIGALLLATNMWAAHSGTHYSKATAVTTGNGKAYVSTSSSSPEGGSWSGTNANDQTSLIVNCGENKDNHNKNVYYFAEANTGYHFLGWSVNGSETTNYDSGSPKEVSIAITDGNDNKKESKADEKAKYYAYFAANTYSVAFDANTGEGSMDNMSFTYDAEQTLVANAFTKSYTVTYDVDGGAPAQEDTICSLPFAGWATSADGQVVYPDEQPVSNLTTENNATVTLYAVWGTPSTIILPTVTKDGFVLDGWYDGEIRVGVAGDTYSPSADVTLKANWVEIYDTYGEYSAAFCAGDSIEYNGVWYKEAFVGNDTLVAANHLGGDSIVMLTVTVNPTYSFKDNQIEIEEGTDSLWHEISLEELAVGEHVLYDSLKVAETGCDSVWAVKVVVSPKIFTALDNTVVAPAATKFFRNGSLYIRRGEALYDMSGRKVK